MCDDARLAQQSSAAEMLRLWMDLTGLELLNCESDILFTCIHSNNSKSCLVRGTGG